MLIRIWSIGHSHSLPEGMQTGTALGKTVWQFLTKLNTGLLYGPTIVPVAIYPKELKTYVHTKPCKSIFIATLFIIAVHAYNGILFSDKKK